MAKKKSGAKKLTTLNDKILLKTVGSRIEQFRMQAGLLPYDVTGDEMPVKSRQHWRRIECGQKNINLTTLFKICRTLGITSEDLLKDIK